MVPPVSESESGQSDNLPWLSVGFNLLAGIAAWVSWLMAGFFQFRQIPSALMGILILLFYAGEAWAYRVRTKAAQVKASARLQKAQKETGLRPSMPSLPGRLQLAIWMRMCLRFGLFAILLQNLGIPADALPWWAIGLLAICLLAELYLLAEAMGWLEESGSMGKETSGRKKKSQPPLARGRVTRIPPQNTWRAAGIFLMVSGAVYAEIFFGVTQATVREFVLSSGPGRENPWFVLGMLTLMNLVFCLLLMLPGKLAFRMEEFYAAKNESALRKQRLSFIFACLSASAPGYILFFQAWQGSFFS